MLRFIFVFILTAPPFDSFTTQVSLALCCQARPRLHVGGGRGGRSSSNISMFAWNVKIFLWVHSDIHFLKSISDTNFRGGRGMWMDFSPLFLSAAFSTTRLQHSVTKVKQLRKDNKNKMKDREIPTNNYLLRSISFNCCCVCPWFVLSLSSISSFPACRLSLASPHSFHLFFLSIFLNALIVPPSSPPFHRWFVSLRCDRPSALILRRLTLM